MAGLGAVTLAGVWCLVDAWLSHRAYLRGLSQLAAGDATAARASFDHSIPLWGSNTEVEYRAAQAARRAGDYAAAVGHLSEAKRLGSSDADLRTEHALIAAQTGVPFPRIEGALLEGMDGTDPVSAPDSAAALAAGYVGQFRVVEAGAVTDKWVTRWPGDLAAWKLRADVLERLVRREAARAAYARWVELAPDDRRGRLGLVRLLLETQAPMPEVVAHLNQLEAGNKADPEALRYRARAQVADGRADEAAATLDRAIAAAPADARSLSERAKLDLEHGRPSTAAGFARRAVAADSGDVEARYTLFRCLQQIGPPSEAAEAEANWKRTTADLTRVNELGKQISAAPFDPGLRCEMGELFLRNARDADGVRWLESALAIRADHGPSHRVLADHYAKVGRPDLAAAHSRWAK